jgi:hypothetical protein
MVGSYKQSIYLKKCMYVFIVHGILAVNLDFIVSAHDG